MGSLARAFFAESLREFYGKFAEICTTKIRLFFVQFWELLREYLGIPRELLRSTLPKAIPDRGTKKHINFLQHKLLPKRHINFLQHKFVPKRHIKLFQHNFLAPAQNAPFWTLRKQFLCLISWKRTSVRGTMFVRNGDVTPGPSRERETSHLLRSSVLTLRDDQDMRSNRVTVQWRRARAESVTVPSSRVTRECCSPGLRSQNPPLKTLVFFLRFPVFSPFPIFLAFLTVFPFFSKDLGVPHREKTLALFGASLPREASTLFFKIRSCTVRSDLKNRHKIGRKCRVLKIRSCSARSELKNKSARFSG